MIDRRTMLAGASCAMAFLAGGCASSSYSRAPGFVRRIATQFLRDGQPYRIVGANMWYAAWLGTDAEYGDRARLMRELDRLQAMGLNNLRIMAKAHSTILSSRASPAAMAARILR